MGVLDPIKENSEEVSDIRDKRIDMLDLTLENLNKYGSAIINNKDELIDEDAFFYTFWREEPVTEIDTLEELNEVKKLTNEIKIATNVENLKGKYALNLAKALDTEPNPQKPLESWEELGKLYDKLEKLPGKINEKMAENHNLDEKGFDRDAEFEDYVFSELFYILSDNINAFPVIEGSVEAQNLIEKEREQLIEDGITEHEEHLQDIDREYDKTSLALEPVDWEEKIEAETLREYLDIGEIPTVTYGDSLHLMMEEICESIEGVEPEYPLHFQNPGSETDISKENRIDNTVRPDAVDDMFVYEFKHMPLSQKNFLSQNGGLKHDSGFIENVKQLNSYLDDLEMPAGMLVYISSDMEVEEYIVEHHEVDDWRNYEDSFSEEYVHKREEYDFESMLKDF